MREVKVQVLVVSIFASHLLPTSTGGEKLGKQYYCLALSQKFL
jgi:hypothetical protein